MLSFRTLALAFAILTAPAAFAASHGPAAETRTETATPTMPNGVLAARRATASIFDALRLSTAQAARLQARTEAELRTLTLAATPTAVAAAERHYLLSVGRVLTPSQFAHYCALQASLETPLEYLQSAESR